jgi:hypothetical protein
MANPTTNYGWPMPTATDLVTDLPADFAAFGQPVDTSLKALNPETTLGDIAYRSATSNTNTRLGIGSTGQVLTVTAGVPAWEAVAAGGMTLINSGGTTLTGASVVVSSIPSTYNALIGYVVNFKPATDDSALTMRINADSGANRYFNTTATTTTNSPFDTTSIALGIGQDNSTATGISIIQIPQYANATTWKYVSSQSITNNATTATNCRIYVQNGLYNQTAAITSLTLLPDAGNFTSGTFYLYGVK